VNMCVAYLSMSLRKNIVKKSPMIEASSSGGHQEAEEC
jgi:hypothetical protein